MNWIKRICRENGSIIISLGLALFIMFVYLSKATANVPIMDYWRYINSFVDKMFTDTITFNDLWLNQGVYRYPVIYGLFLLNVKLFHYNTQIEIFGGCVVMAITSIILYKLLKEYFCDYKKYIKYFGYCMLLMAVFNLNQWEILTLEFSLGFALRILSFILVFKYTDYFLCNMTTTYSRAIILAMIYIFVICLFGAAYFPAMIGAVFFTIVFRLFVFLKEEKLGYVKQYIILCAGLIIGTCIYMNGIVSSDITISENGLFSAVFNFNILRALVIMLGSSLVGVYGVKISFFVGCVFLGIYIFAIVWYLYNKMYKKTYMPMLLIAYAIMVTCLIYLGRSSVFNLEYLTSSRYVCETTIGIIGVSWILLDCFSNNNSNLRFLRKSICCCMLIFIIISIGCSCLKEYNTAIYRKAYADNLIKNMTKIEELDSSEIALYQANYDELVINGVKIMKKYNLGVFHDANSLVTDE